MMSNPIVSIIIVNWNGGKVFERCLASLKKLTYKNYELIIVDNGSSDGTQEYATIKNKKNLGFAGGNNIGLEKAKGKYILLLNNDTEVERDFLDKLLERINKDSSIGIIQPKIYVMSDARFIDSAGSFLTITGFLQHWGLLNKDGKEFEKEAFIFSAKGACMLIRKKIIDQVGLFDEDYGSYLEDTDFSWKTWLLGYKVLFYPESHIYHKIGFTSKRQNQISVNYHSFKNRIATLLKNLSFVNLFLIGGIHFFILFVLICYYLITLRISNAKIILKAVWWNFVNWKKIYKKREFIQRERKVDDKEIFKYILKPFDIKAMFNHFIRSEKMFIGKHEV